MVGVLYVVMPSRCASGGRARPVALSNDFPLGVCALGLCFCVGGGGVVECLCYFWIACCNAVFVCSVYDGVYVCMREEGMVNSQPLPVSCIGSFGDRLTYSKSCRYAANAQEYLKACLSSSSTRTHIECTLVYLKVAGR